jgi:hypothetical protein
MTAADAASDPPHGHAVGALAEEAGQLLDVVAAKLAALRLEGQQHQAETPPGDDLGDDHESGQPCVGWCPICRSAELLKGERPELTQKFVDAALLVVTTLRSLIPPPAPTQTRDPTDGDGSAGVERIEIR